MGMPMGLPLALWPLWAALLAPAPLPRDPLAPLAPLAVHTLDGKAATVDLVGAVTVIEFFATWNEDCRKSQAALARLAKKFPDVRFVVVASGEIAPVVKKFLTTSPFSRRVRVLHDPPASVMAAMDLRVFPAFVVVDAQARVAATVVRWKPGAEARLGLAIEAALGPRVRAPVAEPAALTDDERARAMGVEVLR